MSPAIVLAAAAITAHPAEARPAEGLFTFRAPIEAELDAIGLQIERSRANAAALMSAMTEGTSHGPHPVIYRYGCDASGVLDHAVFYSNRGYPED